MKRIIYYSTILLLAFIAIPITTATATAAATNNNYRERVYLQTDKEVYLSGELLWLKLVLTDDKGVPTDFSKVGYVELMDEKTAQAQVKVDLKAGVGQGWMELPAMLPTGYYRLTAYTRYMRNEGDTVFFQKTIGVINTFRRDEAIPTDERIGRTEETEETEGNNNQLQVLANKTSYGKREMGEITIKGLPRNLKTLSLSIAGKEFVPVPNEARTLGTWQKRLNTLSNVPQTTDYLAEYEGHIVEAKLVNTRTGEAPKEAIIAPLLGFVGDDIRLFGGQQQADKETVLFFTTRIAGMKELATASIVRAEDPYRLDIQSPFAKQAPKALKPFALNPAWQEALTARNVGLRVTRTFTADSMGHIANEEPHFRAKPAKSYPLDDYKRFPTMGETVFEFVESVSFRSEKDGKHTLFVLLSDLTNNKVSLNKPLVLLDGIPILDHELMYQYNPALVKRLDVYRERYAFGGQVFEGIVAFWTYKNDYTTLKLNDATQLFDYEGMQQVRLFYAPDYSNESNRLSRLPDYRHTLLWQPEVQTEGVTEITLPFSTSDLAGAYTVIAEGITETGEAIRGVQQITID